MLTLKCVCVFVCVDTYEDIYIYISRIAKILRYPIISRIFYIYIYIKHIYIYFKEGTLEILGAFNPLP